MQLELTTAGFMEYLKTKHDTDETFKEWLDAQDETAMKAYAGLYAWEQGMLLAGEVNQG